MKRPMPIYILQTSIAPFPKRNHKPHYWNEDTHRWTRELHKAKIYADKATAQYVADNIKSDKKIIIREGKKDKNGLIELF